MSDDLSAFFAKKKDKKKKAAVKLEDVGHHLERNERRQFEFQQETEEASEKRGVEEERANLNSEESEWIEYGDSNQGRLEGLKIKDMGLESEDTQVDNQEPEDREVHETKTWGQVNSEKKASEEAEHAVTITDKQMAAAYMPPALRRNAGGPTQRSRGAPVNFDMSSAQLFPSLADASKIEKSKKEEAKGPTGWSKVGSGPTSVDSRPHRTVGGSGREEALAAVKNMLASNPAPSSAPTRQAPVVTAAAPAATPAPTAAAPAPGRYVPPALRRNQ